MKKRFIIPFLVSVIFFTSCVTPTLSPALKTVQTESAQSTPTPTPISFAGLLADALRHYEAGDYEEAILYYEMALEIEPRNFDAQLGLGKTYRKANMPEKAIEALLKAQQINPKHANAAMELYRSYMDTGEFDALELNWRGVLNEELKSDICIGIAYYYLQCGMRQEALDLIEEQMRATSNDIHLIDAWYMAMHSANQVDWKDIYSKYLKNELKRKLNEEDYHAYYIQLVDLDFDGTPELLIMFDQGSARGFLETEVYTVVDGKRKIVSSAFCLSIVDERTVNSTNSFWLYQNNDSGKYFYTWSGGHEEYEDERIYEDYVFEKVNNQLVATKVFSSRSWARHKQTSDEYYLNCIKQEREVNIWSFERGSYRANQVDAMLNSYGDKFADRIYIVEDYLRSKFLIENDRIGDPYLSAEEIKSLNDMAELFYYVPAFSSPAELSKKSILWVLEAYLDFAPPRYRSVYDISNKYDTFGGETYLISCEFKADVANCIVRSILDVDIPDAHGYFQLDEFKTSCIDGLYHYDVGDPTGNNCFLSAYKQISANEFFLVFDLNDRTPPGPDENGILPDGLRMIVRRSGGPWGFYVISQCSRNFFGPDYGEIMPQALDIDFDNMISVKTFAAVSTISNNDNLEAFILEGKTRKYEYDELRAFSKSEIALIRNGMYALSGLIFNKSENLEYFSSKSWYMPASKNVDSLMNSFQKQNVTLCVKFENDMRWR